jgi:hypothetical protein
MRGKEMTAAAEILAEQRRELEGLKEVLSRALTEP